MVKPVHLLMLGIIHNTSFDPNLHVIRIRNRVEQSGG